LAADRLLLRLKTQGPQTAAELGAALGVTGEAARQQLVKLAEDGLVKAQDEPRGVGRPARVWKLTALGEARFPDAHAELTVQLIQAIRGTLGEKALGRLIAAREAETRKRYLPEFRSAPDLEQRVAKLAAIRNREGYMVEWRKDADGFVLVENHCPICSAAKSCPGLCRAEQDLFRRVLGPGVRVTRTEHILEGARRCAYRIEPDEGIQAKGRRE
jgi:predicted ArsR family transcriptional regulator